jgi:quinol monooxygenase YgiN
MRRPWDCREIDVLQVEGATNKFFFYEIYQDSDAISHHKEQPHYLAWAAFKESGGVISSASKKASGLFLS